MSEENKIRDAADAIKGIVEAVPVYQDVVQPAAKEIGTALQTVAKTVHVALAPVSGLVWGFEQIRDWLQKTLTEKLKDVPPEEIVSPRVAIAGPTIEALRFVADEPILRELYANLLAASMSSQRRDKVHPAFVDIIKQLDVIDVHILNAIYVLTKEKESGNPASPQTVMWLNAYGSHRTPVHKHEVMSKVEVSSESYETSLDNLIRVRCVASYVEGKSIKTETHDRHEYYEDATVDHQYNIVHITNLGLNFVETCTAQK